jgi:Na+-translocating ferredoxin:NAD+ oxidoreductase RnfC subunit
LPLPIKSDRQIKKVSTKRLINILQLNDYKKNLALDNKIYKPKNVTIHLKQHVGEIPCVNVKINDIIKQGKCLTTLLDNKISANIHASIDGKITEITDEKIEICSKKP